MPSFTYTDIKWPAGYLTSRLPAWLSASQRKLCNRAERVSISSDGSVAKVIVSPREAYTLTSTMTWRDR